MNTAKDFIAGLCVGFALGAFIGIAFAFHDEEAPRVQPYSSYPQPNFVNPYGPPTQGSPYADRDRKKNPC